MDEISIKYQQEAQKQFDRIELVSQAFFKQCELLKNDAEKAIATLDPQAPDKEKLENRIKLKLKNELKTVLEQFEKELKRSFGIGLVELESIYHQKDLHSMAELEKELYKL